ncbi:MAG: zinc-binding dehydrogenase [Candidatus Hodarchaeota archaeon]
MKAILIHEFGGIEKLQYSDFPKPLLGEKEVLVKVKAVALNHLDLFVRRGIPGLRLEMPHILGSDIAGKVAEIGPKVKSRLEIGQKIVIDPSIYCGTCEFCIQGQHSLCLQYGIIGEHKRGGYAEFISVPAKNAIRIPNESNLNFVQAAAVPLTFMTAYRMVMTRAKLKAGEDILITGIGGGVALAALQIAKLVGARTFVTSSSNEKLEKAKGFGADFAINYIKTPDFHKEVYSLTNKRGVDVVVDSAGKSTWEKSMRSLRKGGRLVTCGATTGPIAETNINLLFWKQLDLLGSTMGSRAELRAVLKLIWEGRLKPIVETVLPLNKAQKAHQILEGRSQFGKIVLKP